MYFEILKVFLDIVGMIIICTKKLKYKLKKTIFRRETSNSIEENSYLINIDTEFSDSKVDGG